MCACLPLSVWVISQESHDSCRKGATGPSSKFLTPPGSRKLEMPCLTILVLLCHHRALRPLHLIPNATENLHLSQSTPATAIAPPPTPAHPRPLPCAHLGSRSTPAYKSPAQSPPQRITPVACRRSPLAARPPRLPLPVLSYCTGARRGLRPVERQGPSRNRSLSLCLAWENNLPTAWAVINRPF